MAYPKMRNCDICSRGMVQEHYAIHRPMCLNLRKLNARAKELEATCALRKSLLQQSAQALSEHAVVVDGEWGSCRTLEELIAEDQMSPLWHDIKEEIANDR